MAARDIVVIGASAGGLGALRRLVAPLPDNLPAALFVVLHSGTIHRGELALLVEGAGRLRARLAQDGDSIVNGRILIAPADCHMRLERERVRIIFGPRENHARPAIDPLFRSAAFAFGPRVIGIILSGMLDDGCSGLQQIHKRGGVVLVQVVAADHGRPVDRIGARLPQLVAQTVPEEAPMAPRDPEPEVIGVRCPACEGPISVIKVGESLNFHCVAGHRYGPEAMRESHLRRMEDTLWSAVASLREHASLLRKMASGSPSRAALYVTDADLKEQHAAQLEGLIEKFVR
ncbi:MAG: chemotaxis protein CheB [Bryobacteraceae bacterium]|nr:chemotaxis protein CheB [Bryobacteraceae bacterium]